MLKTFSLFLLASLISLQVLAEDYKDPNHMSQEEYAQAQEYGIKHEECMTEYSLSQLQQQPDIRVIADHSMKHCAPVLEEFYEKILSWNYPPKFGSFYVSRISNKNANRLLNNLMRQMAISRE